MLYKRWQHSHSGVMCRTTFLNPAYRNSSPPRARIPKKYHSICSIFFSKSMDHVFALYKQISIGSLAVNVVALLS